MLRKVRIVDKPGFYKGKPLSDYDGEVMALKRDKELDKAEELLLHLVAVAEEASKAPGNAGLYVSVWYHLELAKIYRKRRDYQSEIDILERACNRRHPPGVTPRRLMERLEQARQAAGVKSPLLKVRGEVEDEILEEFDAWRKGRLSENQTCADG